jgi:hypothetical protein
MIPSKTDKTNDQLLELLLKVRYGIIKQCTQYDSFLFKREKKKDFSRYALRARV